MESMTSHEFTHFRTADECSIYLLNNTHIKIAHKCCGGKGFAFSSTKEIISVKKGLETEKYKNCKKSKGTCDICFMESDLYQTCNCCHQPFCGDCLEKITSKVCPYCRGILSS